MFRLPFAALAALTLLQSPAVAQTATGSTGTIASPLTGATTPPKTNAAPAPAQNPVKGPILDLGKPVAAGPQIGDRYAKESFGDWQLACVKSATGKDPCSLLQVLTDPSGNPIAEFSMFRLANGGAAVAGATVIVPLETLLPAQLMIAVDGGTAKRYSYTFCNPVGCIAQIGFTKDDVAAFKRGASATLTLVPAPAPDQQINLALSLKGFTAGYEKVDVVQQN